jgi:hypothetical protein
MADGKMPSDVLEKFKEQRDKKDAASDDGGKMGKRRSAKEKAQKFKKARN